MLSEQKRFLFIHVPKTGGNSIQSILRNYSDDLIVVQHPNQDGVERFGVRNLKYNFTKHTPLSHYKSLLDSALYQSLYKFATIRNPWEMLVSYYFSPHRGMKQWDRADFLGLLGEVPTLRQFICERPDQGLPLLADIDFLIRFERLDEDFRAVCERLHIVYETLPRRNRSEREHYSKYYDDELRDLVSVRFAEEIAVGQYAFDRR